MTALSLFHRPSFDAKLSQMGSVKQVHALLAAMFSFSSRFMIDVNTSDWTETASEAPSPSMFHSRVSPLIEESLCECEEGTPPLCLLQAMIINTFQELTHGVHSRAWRSLGLCTRIAYELQLHRIDLAMYSSRQVDDTHTSRLAEERRRAWWALWELDVFASSVRRLPNAIDWTNNSTLLPIDDESWYTDKSCNSCLLSTDPRLRWKWLQESGNVSSKAWFIVVNSLMRDAQLLSDSQSLLANPAKSGVAISDNASAGSANETEIKLEVLANALYCLTIALPPRYSFRYQFLHFQAVGTLPATRSLQEDCAIYSIHMMIQVTRLMIYRHRVLGRPHQDLRSRGVPWKPSSEANLQNEAQTLDEASEKEAWSHYLDAADNIIAVIRNSSKHHIQYINPFVASTIWLAATAQVVGRLFGPPTMDLNLAESNVDLLRSVIASFVSFWNMSDSLKTRLDTLEASLQTLKSPSAKAQHSLTKKARSTLQGEEHRDESSTPQRGVQTQNGPHSGILVPSVSVPGSSAAMATDNIEYLPLFPASNEATDIFPSGLIFPEYLGFGVDEFWRV